MKKKKKQTPKMDWITFRMTPHKANCLRAAARRHGLDVGEYIRLVWEERYYNRVYAIQYRDAERLSAYLCMNLPCRMLPSDWIDEIVSNIEQLMRERAQLEKKLSYQEDKEDKEKKDRDQVRIVRIRSSYH